MRPFVRRFLPSILLPLLALAVWGYWRVPAPEAEPDFVFVGYPENLDQVPYVDDEGEGHDGHPHHPGSGPSPRRATEAQVEVPDAPQDAADREETHAGVRVIRLRGSPDDEPAEPPAGDAFDADLEGSSTTGLPELWPVSRAGIREAMAHVRPDIRECYRPWLEAEGDVAGRVTVGMTVVADEEASARGRITAVEIRDSEFEHPLLEGCLVNVLEDLRFEAPPGGEMRIVYPFVFSPGQSASFR